jgi:hypothetical protein
MAQHNSYEFPCSQLEHAAAANMTYPLQSIAFMGILGGIQVREWSEKKQFAARQTNSTSSLAELVCTPTTRLTA